MVNNQSKKSFNKIIIIVGAIAVLLAGIAAAILLVGNAMNTRDGKIISFSYSHGSGMGGFEEYMVFKKDNSVILKYQCMGCFEEENVEKKIDAKYLDDLAGIINDYKIAKWDGFDQSDDGVLDGDGFTLKVEYDDKKSIEAHGYMKYPGNYKEARDVILDKLEEVRNS